MVKLISLIWPREHGHNEARKYVHQVEEANKSKQTSMPKIFLLAK